jgi:hypothetical protein
VPIYVVVLLVVGGVLPILLTWWGSHRGAKVTRLRLASQMRGGKTHFTVVANGYTGRFSSFKHAMEYGEMLSDVTGEADVYHNGGGIVGQYRHGKSTPEFLGNHQNRDK